MKSLYVLFVFYACFQIVHLTENNKDDIITKKRGLANCKISNYRLIKYPKWIQKKKLRW